MKSISLNITKAASFLAEGAVKAYEPKVKAAQEALENKAANLKSSLTKYINKLG